MANGVTEKECKYLKIDRIGRMLVCHLFFDSVSDIARFIAQNPPVNEVCFPIRVSERADVLFAGPPLQESISYCTGGYEEGYKEFMELSRQLEAVNRRNATTNRSEPSLVGSRPNVPAYVAGAPKSMLRRQRAAEKRVIRLVMNLSYGRNTTENQIKNRGILVLNLISLLEQNNYIVDFRLMDASYGYEELFLFEVRLKRPGQKLDPGLCYFPMCSKAFLRRIISRIKESMPFRDTEWGVTYGKVAGEEKIKRYSDYTGDAIFIGTPQSLGIVGQNIFADADAFLHNLGLSDTIRVPRYVVTEENQEGSMSWEDILRENKRKRGAYKWKRSRK